MSYFGVSTRNGVGLGLGTVPSLTNTPLGYRLAPSLDLSFAGSDTLSPAITFSRTTNATLTNSAGLVANAPMNLLTFSEQFDNAAWNKLTGGTGVAPVVIANTAAAPNGTTTADQVVFNRGAGTTSSDISYLAFSLTAFTATATASVWLKTTDGTTKTMSFRCGAPAAQQITVTGEWQRFTLTQTNATIDRVQILLYGNDGAQTVSVNIWGAQLELGSTATTYNPTTVKNLLGFTENFDNAAWTKSNASISATKVDDIYGQPFAQKLVEDTTLAGHSVGLGVAMTAGAPYTSSVFAKQGERRYVFLRFIAGGAFATNHIAIFDLQNGTATNNAGLPVTAFAITSVGNGWYRCSITQAAATTGIGQFGVYLSADGVISTYTGDGTSGAYIFGAQLSDSASVDPYVYNPVAAPSSVAYYGPRFDYDPVTLAPKGLLIEEQRTNLVTYSEQFDNAAWIKGNATVTANAVISPDGTVDADKIVENTSNAFHGVYNATAISTPSGTVFSWSIFAKAAERSWLRLDAYTSSSVNTWFDLQNGVVGTVGAGVTASITPVGNGWYRCVVVRTSSQASAVADGFLGAYAATANNVTTYTGNGTSGIYIWGAQLEAGAFATSYIPTVASQVTRAADSASMIGNNFARWYNQTEGTVFAQYSVNGLNPGASNAAYGISDNTTANFIAGRTLSSAATNFQVRTGGADQVALNSTSVAAGAVAKSAGAYALNNFAFTANAGTAQTDTAGTLPVVTQMQIGGLTSSVNPLNGTISRIAYYNRRLSNTELQGITS